MSDGKLLNDALVALREACGLPEGTPTLVMLARAAALAREAMAARALLHRDGTAAVGMFGCDAAPYEAARAANEQSEVRCGTCGWMGEE